MFLLRRQQVPLTLAGKVEGMAPTPHADQHRLLLVLHAHGAGAYRTGADGGVPVKERQRRAKRFEIVSYWYPL